MTYLDGLTIQNKHVAYDVLNHFSAKLFKTKISNKQAISKFETTQEYDTIFNSYVM